MPVQLVAEAAIPRGSPSPHWPVRQAAVANERTDGRRPIAVQLVMRRPRLPYSRHNRSGRRCHRRRC